MPALPNVSKVIKVLMKQADAADTNLLWHFYLQYSGTLSLTDLTTIVNTIISAWNTNMKPITLPTYSLSSVEATDLSSPTSPQVTVGSGAAGTGGGTALGGMTAIVVQFKIARRYRGGHPRIYLPGPIVSGLASPEAWTGAYVSSVQTPVTAFFSAVVTSPPAAVGTLTLCNVSYFAGFTNKTFPSGRTHPVPTPRALPVVDTVTSAVVSNKPGTQRRRMLR